MIMRTTSIAEIISRQMRAAGTVKGGLSAFARRTLEELEYHDLVLQPSDFRHFGMDQTGLFEPNNIGRIRVLSSVSKERPEELASWLAGLSNCRSARQVNDHIVSGVKLNLVTIKEAEIISRQDEFDEHLDRAVESRGGDFVIVPYVKDFTTGTMDFPMRTVNDLNGEKIELSAHVHATRMDNSKFVTAHVTLPKDSPNLAGKLNQFFGMPWFKKQRPRFITPGSFQSAVYSWGYYQVPNAETNKWVLIQGVVRSDDCVLAGASVDFKKIDPGLKQTFYAYLEDQLRHMIGNLPGYAGSQDVSTALWWDIGIARELARSD